MEVIIDEDRFDEIVEAYRLVGRMPSKEELCFADHHGWTVAHELASKGKIFDDMDILSLADLRGYTVAHEMSRCGHVFMDPSILRMKTKNGEYVGRDTADYQFDDDIDGNLILVQS